MMLYMKQEFLIHADTVYDYLRVFGRNLFRRIHLSFKNS